MGDPKWCCVHFVRAMAVGWIVRVNPRATTSERLTRQAKANSTCRTEWLVSSAGTATIIPSCLLCFRPISTALC